MNTQVPANVREHLKGIARHAEFESLMEVLRAELEDTKATLVRADVDNVRRLQGYAQAIIAVIELVTPKKA